ncbi:dATP/dGTP pyrophosphohydrolase domain-containing protein [Aquamicrobium terrae]
MNKSKDDLARWILHLLDCRDENERLRVQRVVDLLEANNCYQQLARDARTTLKTRFDLVTHLERQREFSLKTFGPGTRAAGVVDHIRKELREIEADPTEVEEWIDVIILAFDGAWRAGYEPAQIVKAIVAKQAKNEKRRWPDWRTADPDKAIEHDRSADRPAEGESHG